ncbi:MAG: acyltransferase [Oscillospiraceae bacterium]|nr:acyltransferase [Oscillospiraceae bacterium]
MRGRGAALDRFRLVAAVLVVAIHTSPLTTWSAAGDFWLTRVLGRVAVPFFLMTTGYFLGKKNWRGAGRTILKTLGLYVAAVVLYLPLNFYSGGFSPAEWVRRLAVDGTFYHLWYFPAAALGVAAAWLLSRLGMGPALAAAGVLYLVGLGGDSYYGFAAGVPALESVYGHIFDFCSYTRNGLFFAPLFLLLGAAGASWSGGVSAAGTAVSLGAMSLEALWLRAAGVQRHDSMYVLLPVLMVFLFSLLLSMDRGRDRRARDLSLLVYLLHPWCIVLVRGGAKVAGLQRWLIDNSGGHFLAVLAVSLCAAWCVCAVGERVRR